MQKCLLGFTGAPALQARFLNFFGCLHDDYASICRRQSCFSRAFELLEKEFREEEIEYYKFLKNQAAFREENIRMI